MTAWSHLPNAAHIDWVLTNIRSFSIRPIPAACVSQEVAQDAASRAARCEVYGALVLTETRDVALDAAWDVTWDAPQQVTVNIVMRDAILNAILALVVYDHCAQYLTMTADQLRVWCALNYDPAAILLLPYVTFLENATSKETS